MNVHMTQLHRTLFPLTSPQREIWFDQILHQEIPLYNIGGYVKMPGVIDATLFEHAINLLVQKHDTLRTVLTEVEDEDGIPMLAYAEKLFVTVSVQDFSSKAQAHETAMAWMQQRFMEPFELTGQPLFRYDLVKISDDNYYWLIQYHHLIVDGYAVALLNRSMAEIYTQLAHGQVPHRESPSYVTFIDNDRAYVESTTFEKQRQYWLDKYPTPPEPVLSPRYRSQSTDKLIGSGCEVLYLPRDFYQRLNELAKHHQASLFHLLLGVFYVYFTRTAQCDDFAIGLPVLNRANAHFKKTAGLFTGVSPTLFNFGQGLSFAELLQQINKTLKANYRHQRFPVSEINRAVGLEQQRSQLFDISLSYENHDNDACFAGIDGQFTPLLHGYEQTPLIVFVRDFHIHHDVKLDFVFNLAYFNTNDIKALQTRFVTILDAVLKDSVSPIHRLPIMTKQEVEQLQAWNDTTTDYPKDQTLVDLFEQQVAKTPEAIALVFEGQSLSYQQLNAKANQLAHYLLSVHASSGSVLFKNNPLIAIAVERSLEMVIGLLAILKMGGAYVPIDPSYPAARIRYLLEDSATPLFLTQGHLSASLPLAVLDQDCVVVCLDEVDLAEQSIENPKVNRQAEDLAYVIYTSGSTGKPKGVMVEHQGAVNLAIFQQQYLHVNTDSHILQFASLSFDAATWEVIMSLCSGGTLRLAPMIKIHTDLKAVLQEQAITHTILPPSVVNILSNDKLPDLKYLIVGGEVCSPELVRRWTQSGRHFINAYGPTEATVCASVFECTPNGNIPPIGQPIANTRVYILDAQHQPLPPGLPGELCIAGAGLARGYLNRPDLTAEKFIDVELFGKTERIYKTGDLARWLPDGNLEYLGRLDHQVKLRGFRIELGEIEAVLRQHPDVNEAVVTLFEEEGNKRLVAYLTENKGRKPEASDTLITACREWLTARFPDYMVPASFRVLDQLPLTPNGKIDRKALPAPAFESSTDHQPMTPNEDLLASLWADVLKRDSIGRQDNFFELGGHSLLATQLIARIRTSFQVELPIRAIFEFPQLLSLATAIEAATDTIRLPAIDVQATTAAKDLSFAQQRLWFLHQLEDNHSATYNMPAALQLSGALNIDALQQSLHWVVERHSSLRSYFPMHEGQAQLQIQAMDTLEPLVLHDLRALPKAAQDREVQTRSHDHAIAPFDLAQGPLFKADLLQLSETQSLLLLNMHHIISDGWSMGVFVRDWQSAYAAFVQGQPPSRSPLAIQYSDYAAWQRQWLQGDVLQQHVEYWRQQLAGIPELLALPTDKARPPQQSYQGAHYSRRLSSTLSRALSALSRQQGVTLFMTLLSAFNLLLSRYSGQQDICVGSPIANRTHRQTEDLIGFFVNTLVLRTELNPLQSFNDVLQVTRQRCLEAYAHQDIPFEMLVEQLQPTRSLSHHPLFQVMFVLQNNPDSELKLADVNISAQETDYPIAKFDLTLSMEERDGQLHGIWEYATDLFEADTIERMAGHFEVLLNAIIDHPERAISQLPMLSEQDVQQLQAWNDTTTDYPKDQTIVDLFEQQVANTPAAIALVFEDQSLSYQQLNARANQLAHYLLSLKTRDGTRQIQPDTLVAICMERSPDIVVTLLGILKAGAAYVPIDPEYPAERIAFMLQESAVSALITQASLKDQLPLGELKQTCQVFCLNDTAFAKQSTENPSSQSLPESLAYVIYTSGSTGKPKGVAVEHQGLVLHMRAMLQSYAVTPADRVLQFASFSFDISIEQCLLALSSGACSVMVKTNLMVAQNLLTLLQEQAVSIADFSPAYWQQMLETVNVSDSLSQLRILILGGEALPFSLALQTREYFPSLCWFNSYGPTEAVIAPTIYQLPKILSNKTTYIPIGRPRANTRVHILDDNHQPLPPGLPGELCIAGTGLARGYLKHPNLTAEKFIDVDLFGQRERIYKTGDLARWQPDGNLDYLGRLDYQVKLRGFRIELGEIEAVLRQHPAINEAVVILFEDEQNKRLVAYVTEDKGRKPEANDTLVTACREWLTVKFPDYMVPASFLVLDQLPLTPNGKIDRQALPAPDIHLPAENTLPRDAVELQLLGVWEAVLHIHPLGIYDNFFELGGHSLLAVKLMSHIQHQFDVRLPVSALFQSPTVASLAQQLRQDFTPRFSNIVPLQTSGEVNPVYCLPGAIGSVMYLYPLASFLGHQQPVYALQTPGLDGSNTPESVEALAKYHLHAMQQQQASGPYQLVGHSSGGRVAFEMAWQLEQQGKTVALLAILDTNAPNSNQPSPMVDYTELNWLSDIVLVFEELSGVELNLSLLDLQSLPDLATAYTQVMQAFQQQLSLFAPEAHIDELKAWVNTYRITVQGHAHYQIPGKLHCPIQLFRASEQMRPDENIKFEDTRETWGWSECTQAEVEVHWVPGTHVTMMTRPQVKTLADKLSHALRHHKTEEELCSLN